MAGRGACSRVEGPGWVGSLASDMQARRPLCHMPAHTQLVPEAKA